MMHSCCVIPFNLQGQTRTQVPLYGAAQYTENTAWCMEETTQCSELFAYPTTQDKGPGGEKVR